MNCRIEFKVDGSFFEAYENDTVSDADLDVSAVVTKEHDRMALDLSITGNVTVKCDRCLADLTVPVDIQVPFSVMFSSYAADADADGDGADEVILLDSDSADIDLFMTMSVSVSRLRRCIPTVSATP